MERQKLEDLKRSELIELARKKGIRGAVLLRKNTLVDKILAADKKDNGKKTVKTSAKAPTKASVKANVATTIKTPDNERVEKTKYFAPNQPAQFTPPANEISFPAGYGDDRIVIMVRDPYWVYAYWEMTPGKHQEARKKLGSKFQGSKFILRVYDVTEVDFNGANAWRFFDIEIHGGANNWYINVGQPNRSWCTEIGYRCADGTFLALARSNIVTTPRDSVSDVIDEEWMTTDYDEIFQIPTFSGASPGMKKKRAKKMQLEMGWSSGSVSSWGRPPVEAKDFWLKVDTELIVYGATKPTAKVTVQGKPIQLRKDGTFSLRFALPDGQQRIPVEAISRHGDRRKITPKVERNTTY